VALFIVDYGALHLRFIREIEFLQRFCHSVALLQVQSTDLFVAIYVKTTKGAAHRNIACKKLRE
jgi:hypothetical protein